MYITHVVLISTSVTFYFNKYVLFINIYMQKLMSRIDSDHF